MSEREWSLRDLKQLGAILLRRPEIKARRNAQPL
jgi:hypothetical protein